MPHDAVGSRTTPRLQAVATTEASPTIGRRPLTANEEPHELAGEDTGFRLRFEAYTQLEPLAAIGAGDERPDRFDIHARARQGSLDQQIATIALHRLSTGSSGAIAGGGVTLSPRSEFKIVWWLNPGSQGQGLAVEGARPIRDVHFDVLAVPSAVAWVHPENVHSAAVAKALGLTHDFTTQGAAGQPIEVFRLRASERR